MRTGNWSLYEDVAGKPGWIATLEGKVASKLRFRLKFGNSTKLSIEYLRSYQVLCYLATLQPRHRAALLPLLPCYLARWLPYYLATLLAGQLAT